MILGTYEDNPLVHHKREFPGPRRLARFREERDALPAQRKAGIVADLKRNGDLDEEGHWVFKKPLPADMHPDSPTDFKQ